MMCRCEPLHSSGYGHMADGFGREQAVHRTAWPHPLIWPWAAQTPLTIISAAVPVRHASVRAGVPTGASGSAEPLDPRASRFALRRASRAGTPVPPLAFPATTCRCPVELLPQHAGSERCMVDQVAVRAWEIGRA